jgi:hypothetical protein
LMISFQKVIEHSGKSMSRKNEWKDIQLLMTRLTLSSSTKSQFLVHLRFQNYQQILCIVFYDRHLTNTMSFHNLGVEKCYSEIRYLEWLSEIWPLRNQKERKF